MVLVKIVAAVCAVPVLLVVAYAVLFYTYSAYPELFTHREFYLACKSIEPGTPLSEARATMARYLEPGRTWQPSETLPAGLFGAQTDHRESTGEHKSRILFIPDAKNIADWCLVYPDGDVVSRVELSPD
jgi:hypothetical protein